MKATLKSRKARFAAVFAAALVVACGALAYFTSAGSGSGTGTAGTAQAVTISAGTPTAELYPGGSADVAISISNPNAFTVHIDKLTLDSGVGSGGFLATGGTGTCTNPDLSFPDNTNGGAGWDVPPASHGFDLTGAISMGAGADNGCQGASFTVYLQAAS
jgi:hypothetical protein